jgi:hypothetical protein
MAAYRALAPSSTVLAFALFVAPAASASTISIPVDAFGADSTLTTFTGLPNNTTVIGSTFDGILFDYSLGAACPTFSPPCGGPLVVSSILGTTNNLNPPSAIAVVGASGNPTVTLTFPSLLDAFGYGFQANATTVTLFSGATSVGSLSFSGAPDPVVTGGFAGIQSTIPFDSAQITFSQSGLIALDNIRTIHSSTAAVPEPGTALLVGAGLVLAARRFYRRNERSAVSRESRKTG